VLVVDDAVAVVVDVGAAVGVLEAVLVLGAIGAAIDAIGDAVGVGVRFLALLGRLAAVAVDVGEALLGDGARRLGARREGDRGEDAPVPRPGAGPEGGGG